MASWRRASRLRGCREQAKNDHTEFQVPTQTYALRTANDAPAHITSRRFRNVLFVVHGVNPFFPSYIVNGRIFIRRTLRNDISVVGRRFLFWSGLRWSVRRHRHRRRRRRRCNSADAVLQPCRDHAAATGRLGAAWSLHHGDQEGHGQLVYFSSVNHNNYHYCRRVVRVHSPAANVFFLYRPYNTLIYYRHLHTKRITVWFIPKIIL